MKLRYIFDPQLHIKYYYHKDMSRMIVTLILFKKCIFKRIFHPGKKKVKKRKKKNLSEYLSRQLSKYLRNYYKRTIKISEVKYVYAGSKFGSEDAALTAFLTGQLYSVYGSALGVLSNFIPLNNVVLQVIPIYNKFYFDFNFQCILKIKTANAIKEIIRFFVWVIKNAVLSFFNKTAFKEKKT